MKQFKQITFLLLLALCTTVVVTSCEDDESETPIPVSGVTLNSTSLSLLVDSAYTLIVSVSPSNATDQTVTWITSDASIATVNNGVVIAVAAGNVTITAKSGDKTATCTVSIDINTIINADGVTGTVIDIEGNTYKIVKIGDQWWMTENLKVTKYNDETSIPNVTDVNAWKSLTSGAYCCFDNDATNANKYGLLYNWYVVNTGKLTPSGWHVPTDTEWTNLQNYLIANGYNYDGSTTGNYIAKSLAATTDWWLNSSTTGAIGDDLTKNNRTGFSALPGGERLSVGSFYGLGRIGYWWSATKNSSSTARLQFLSFVGVGMSSTGDDHVCGCSVRCIRD